MAYVTPIKKKVSRENKKASLREPLILLADFFKGVVINLDEEYSSES